METLPWNKLPIVLFLTLAILMTCFCSENPETTENTDSSGETIDKRIFISGLFNTTSRCFCHRNLNNIADLLFQSTTRGCCLGGYMSSSGLALGTGLFYRGRALCIMDGMTAYAQFQGCCTIANYDMTCIM